MTFMSEEHGKKHVISTAMTEKPFFWSTFDNNSFVLLFFLVISYSSVYLGTRKNTLMDGLINSTVYILLMPASCILHPYSKQAGTTHRQKWNMEHHIWMLEIRLIIFHSHCSFLLAVIAGWNHKGNFLRKPCYCIMLCAVYFKHTTKCYFIHSPKINTCLLGCMYICSHNA